MAVFWEASTSFLTAFEKMRAPGITKVNEALRNGNWETNHGRKDETFFFFLLKKEVKKTVIILKAWYDDQRNFTTCYTE